MSDTKTVRTTVDWEKVEALYRVGSMSLREIGAEHTITEGAIRKRAKRDGWTRDLAEKVRAKADALVRRELVRSEVRKPTHTEAETVEVEASVAARIRLSQRADIGRGRSLVRKLFEELEIQTDHKDLLAEMEQALAEVKEGEEKAKPRLSEALQRVMSTGSRVSHAKSLVESMQRLVALEREAYGIDDKKTRSDTAGDINISF